MGGDIEEVVDSAVRSTPDVAWSICIADGEEALASIHPDDVLSTASIGKLLLLLQLARQLEGGGLDPDSPLTRTEDLEVADSGLWQHFRVQSLPAEDLAVLVAAVSDNLATNVLLQRLGLENIQKVGTSIGLERTRLLDRVRRHRGDEDPARLSEGTARELAHFMSRLGEGQLVSEAVSARLRRWLAINVDLSMVAAPLALDPLAHVASDRGFSLLNKTGTDDNVRADVGCLVGPRRSVSYAVIANWAEHTDPRDSVLETMRTIGSALRGLVE